MRRSLTLALLFVAGCEPGPNPDTISAREFVRRQYRNVEISPLEVEEPEYATITKVEGRKVWLANTPAACGVRVRYSWSDGRRTTHVDWVVWVTRGHQAFNYNDNPSGDKWRQYVRACARK
jgi:hypothetical protein